jgi:hypothetical protein
MTGRWLGTGRVGVSLRTEFGRDFGVIDQVALDRVANLRVHLCVTCLRAHNIVFDIKLASSMYFSSVRNRLYFTNGGGHCMQATSPASYAVSL